MNLGSVVKYLHADRLKQSTRTAPWKITVEIGGNEKSYVLQLDQKTIAYEYQVLGVMERIPIPTPKAYALDNSGKEIGTPCCFCDFIECSPKVQHSNYFQRDQSSRLNSQSVPTDCLYAA